MFLALKFAIIVQLWLGGIRFVTLGAGFENYFVCFRIFLVRFAYLEGFFIEEIRSFLFFF